jgi:hypothetical protein
LPNNESFKFNLHHRFVSFLSTSDSGLPTSDSLTFNTD